VDEFSGRGGRSVNSDGGSRDEEGSGGKGGGGKGERWLGAGVVDVGGEWGKVG